MASVSTEPKEDWKAAEPPYFVRALDLRIRDIETPLGLFVPFVSPWWPW